MGKTKIITESKDTALEGKKGAEDQAVKTAPTKSSSKKRLTSGVLNVEATFNNTKVSFSDKVGNVFFWASSGGLGFKGAKKGTPFAASKVGDIIGSKAVALGVKDSDVVIRGVGSGREPAVRAFMAHGIEISSIKDKTPVPHNGPKAKKPRRV